MRLINVDTLEFALFLGSTIPQYAILSHRWRDGEIDFESFANKSNFYGPGRTKVEAFASYVRTHVQRVNWIWIDTCCIKKSSDAELSEAINSMCKWYQNAEVCLAYLDDVESCHDLEQYKRSEWFERGWTLQELLIPRTVMFLTKSWQLIGYKGTSGCRTSGTPLEPGPLLNAAIAVTSRIPENVLQDFEASRSLSVEERLRWMTGRTTTRREDMSYSLVGIFDVSMPVLYGEGEEKARNRLLDEVRKPSNRLEPSITTVPYQSNPDYIKRCDLQGWLQSKLSTPGTRVALFGLGGVGKTQLAIRAAEELRQTNPATTVLWLHTSNASRFDESLRDLATKLQLPGRDDPQANFLESLQGWLVDTRKGPWLLVLDNADDASFLLQPPIETTRQASTTIKRRIDYFPPCNHGSILITTRSKNEALKLVYPQHAVEVSTMNEDEAVLLLERKIGLSDRLSDSKELAEALEWIPLALSQAGAFIQQRQPFYSIRRYLEEISEMQEKRRRLLKRELPIPDLDREASSSILVTWQLSFEYIQRQSESAANLLSVMSFCDRQAIPALLVRYEERDNDLFEDDIAMLRSFSFIAVNADESSFTMHRLVQDSTQMWLDTLGRSHIHYKKFIWTLNHALTESPWHDPNLWPSLFTVLPHVKIAAKSVPEDKDEDTQLSWASVMFKGAMCYGVRRDWTESLPMFRQSIETRTRILGEQHPDTLDSMAFLGDTLVAAKNWEEAELIRRKTQELSKVVSGGCHWSTVSRTGELAVTIAHQGRYNEARELLSELREMSKNLSGLEYSSDLAINALSFAANFRTDNDSEDAQAFQVEVVETLKTILDLREENDDSVYGMQLLGKSLFNMNRCEEAERLLMRALVGMKMVFGGEHHRTIQATIDTASILKKREKYKEAEILQTEAVAMLEKTQGKGSYSTLCAMFELADIQYDQARPAEAEQLLRQAIRGLKECSSLGDPVTLSALILLFKLQVKAKLWAEAEDTARQILSVSTALYGPDCKETLIWREELAYHQIEQAHWAQAQIIAEQTLSSYAKLYGSRDPGAVRSRALIAECRLMQASYLHEQERWEEAEAITSHLLCCYLELYGLHHQRTLRTMSLVIMYQRAQQHWAEAETTTARLLSGYMKVYGAEHANTLDAISALAYCQSRQER